MSKRIASLIAGASLLASAGIAAAQDRMGEHSMEGQITAINKDTGEVDVNTAPVPMKVHFPAEAVSDLNEGDTITVYLSFEKK